MMGMPDRKRITKRILHLTLEIIYLLTGEEYIVVKKTSITNQSTHLLPPPHPLIHERDNDQKILELTNKILHLLTGEGEDLLDIKIEVIEEEEEEQRNMWGHDELCKEEESPTYACADGSHHRDAPERGCSPHSTDDGTEDDAFREVSTSSCRSNDGEKPDVMPGRQCKEFISTAGERWSDAEADLSVSLHCDMDDGDDHDVQQSEKETSNTPDTQISANSPDPYRSRHDLDVMSHTSGHTGDKRHQQTALAGEKPFSCCECGKGFTKKSSLVRHGIVHVGQKPFACLDCGKCFARKSTLVEHGKTHSSEKPFSCVDCGKRYTRRANLLDHQRTHTGESSFSCLDCGKSFTNRTVLVRHRRSHTGEKPFSCSECGKRFGHRFILLKHQIVHTGEKPFPCSECGKRFTQKGNLIEHRKIHTGEKPFSCSQCGKSFTNKAVLVRHLPTHSGEKPFPCSSCGKYFTQKANLVKHQKCHSSGNP